ncbi:uncharacterized protein ACJ7VT_007011 isoform 2-T2 [Polymixia lowei]
MLRLVLLDRSGGGKSSTSQLILPNRPSSDTRAATRCVSWSGQRNFPDVSSSLKIVDTPDWLSPAISDNDIVEDIIRCWSLSAPGPHAFILVLPLTGPLREGHRWIKFIQEIFGAGALNYVVILFTCSDGIGGSLPQLTNKDNKQLRDLVVTCGNRYHVFNNKSPDGDAQVRALLDKVANMVKANGSRFYGGYGSMSLSKREKESRREAVMAVRSGRREHRWRGLFTFDVNPPERFEEGKAGKRVRDICQSGQPQKNQEERKKIKTSQEKDQRVRRTGREDDKEERKRGQDKKAKERKVSRQNVDVEEKVKTNSKSLDQGARVKERKTAVELPRAEMRKKIISKEAGSKENTAKARETTEGKGRERTSLREAETTEKKMATVERQAERQMKRSRVQEEGEAGQTEGSKEKRRAGSVSGDEERPGPSAGLNPDQRKTLQKPTDCSPLKKEDEDFWTWPIYKIYLPVVCGDHKGRLCRAELAKGGRCIRTETGQWLSPSRFEELGGKKHNKKWKTSIKCGNTPLAKLIKDKHLSCPGNRKRRKHSAEITTVPHSSKSEDSDTGLSTVTSLSQQNDEKDEKNTELELSGGHDSGTCWESPRSRMSPVEFVEEGSSQPDTFWRREDRGHDDKCFICRSEGEDHLVPCEQCRHVFHPKCHLPVVEDVVSGDNTRWTCTFCVLRISQEWQYSRRVTFKTALSFQTSEHLMKCQYLLLALYRADKDKIFTTDPSLKVRGYSTLIKTPMWLDKVAEKLQNNNYQTVEQFMSDVFLIFKCSRDNAEFQAMGVRLKKLFNNDFNKVFSIQQDMPQQSTGQTVSI